MFHYLAQLCLPASLTLPQEAFGGVDRGVSGIGGPVEEEGLLGFRLTPNEVHALLQRWEIYC